MPIKTVEMQPVDEQRFHDIDYLVMKQDFAAQNSLGRFYDEVIYGNELARLCREAGFESVEIEVPITVEHKDFCKTYFMDLLINRSVIYELKTVTAFDGNHRRQLLNYLLLCVLQHGKLLNFRSPRVTHEFVSTALDAKHRYANEIVLDGWTETDAESFRFRMIIEELLADWGAFLESSLYSDAAVHFLGGEERVETPIDVRRENVVIGRQKFRMLNVKTAFFITAIGHKVDYRKHLESLLDNTCIESIQWVNFDKHNIEFITVT